MDEVEVGARYKTKSGDFLKIGLSDNRCYVNFIEVVEGK